MKSASGNILYLFDNLKDIDLRKKIAEHFKIRNVEVFDNYIKTIRIVRNICAHGHNLYDLRLRQSIKTGELRGLDSSQRNNISGCIIVMIKILESISINRSIELGYKITELVANPQFSEIYDIIKHVKVTPNNATA